MSHVDFLLGPVENWVKGRNTALCTVCDNATTPELEEKYLPQLAKILKEIPIPLPEGVMMNGYFQGIGIDAAYVLALNHQAFRMADMIMEFMKSRDERMK